jgi:hypothetical protein
MKDVVGKPILRSFGYNTLAFGRITEQRKEGPWVMVRISWVEDWLDDSEWYKLANVMVIDKPALLNRVQKV